jgi:hypothetical protein
MGQCRAAGEFRRRVFLAAAIENCQRLANIRFYILAAFSNLFSLGHLEIEHHLNGRAPTLGRPIGGGKLDG